MIEALGHPAQFSRSTGRRRIVLSGVLGVAVTACGPSPPPAPPPHAVQAPPEVVTLDPAGAASRAREIQEEVGVQVADGLAVQLWASEQLVADPVAIDFDDLGRAYFTRTVRRSNSEVDIKGHPDWTTESLSFRTVEDRRNFLRRELAPEHSSENTWLEDFNRDGSHDWRDLTVNKERIYRVEDSDGDGFADRSQLMIEDFHTVITGVAGGLLAHGDDLFVGVAPDIWRLRDTNADGVIDLKQSISHGYGVHIGYGGHGVSGLTMGPDGRLYWSIGDIGINVVDRNGKRWAYPHEGTVMRANPDGTDFEVFARGLRNLHEFTFDEYGNLIGVDNDGDHPNEDERIVYVTDGSDSGWRTYWQFGKYTDPDNNTYKVWMDERMHRPRFEGQAAYFTPPIAGGYHSGPAGMTYNPGTALNAEWRDYFFIVGFAGAPARGKVQAFRLEPEGAGFRLADHREVLDGIMATGIEFGPDGALYIADWMHGWRPNGEGRIWKLDAPATVVDPLRQETSALLAAAFHSYSATDLRELLRHADMRVRMKAQFELVERSDSERLLSAARQREHPLARRHGIWGIGQLARKDLRRAAPLVSLLRDDDPEVRAQAAKVIGDVRYRRGASELVPLLGDGSDRVRFFAAEALGRIGYREAVRPIIEMLEANDDQDVYLRHAGTLALARIGKAEPVVALADHPSRGLRIAAVVALRRMRHPGVARFLQDGDEHIVTEAARAINDDASIEAALPSLAEVLDLERFTNEALLRRAINANLRLGTLRAARRVGELATRRRAPEAMRLEALAVLGVWPRPPALDRVDGSYRGAVERDSTSARTALAAVRERLLADSSAPIRVATVEAIGRLGDASAAPSLSALLARDRSPAVRVASLRALVRLEGSSTEKVVRRALGDGDGTVRMAALELIPSLTLPEEQRAQLLVSALGAGSTAERQSALDSLGKLRGPHAEAALDDLLDQLAAGKVAPEIQLDVEEAVEAHGSPALLARLERHRAASSAEENVVAAFGAALRGGDAEKGRSLFVEHAAAQCSRCHSLGEKGADVGPNLGNIGSQLTRHQLLEALVDPSARIAPGFGSPPSAMSPMGALLSRSEIRDVVEFLSTLR